MPANTAKGYPYPVGTDRVMDGDDAIKALAETVDTRLGVAATGIAATPATSSLNQAVSVLVTFPVGRFTAAPAVFVTAVGGGAALGPAQQANPSTTGVTLYCSRVSGGMGPITLGWLAIQNG